jgi:hypothetical protein
MEDKRPGPQGWDGRLYSPAQGHDGVRLMPYPKLQVAFRTTPSSVWASSSPMAVACDAAWLSRETDQRRVMSRRQILVASALYLEKTAAAP